MENLYGYFLFSRCNFITSVLWCITYNHTVITSYHKYHMWLYCWSRQLILQKNEVNFPTNYISLLHLGEGMVSAAGM